MAEGSKEEINGSLAIVGMDVVGFSRLRDEDQLAAIQQLIQWIEQSLASYGIKDRDYRWSPAGDGGYLTFTSSACELAIDVALMLARKAKEARWRPSSGERIDLKLVLHAGTVVERSDLGRDTNVWGDGINTAARILSVCAPSQLLMSQGYYETYVKNRHDAPFTISGVFWRTMKHRLQLPLMNVFQEQAGLGEQSADARRWRAIGSLWERTRNEYESMVHDCLKSNDQVAAIAAAKFLLELGGDKAVFDLCCMVGESSRRPWQYPMQRSFLFGRMPPELLMKVIKQSNPKLMKEGDLLCNEHSPADSCFFLVAGTITVEGEGLDKSIIFPRSDILGEFGLWIPGLRRTAMLRAADEVLVLEILHDRFAQVLSECPPSVAEDLYATIKQRIVANISRSTHFFPATSPLLGNDFICQKSQAGVHLNLCSAVHILFKGKLQIEPDSGPPLIIQAPGIFGNEEAVGILSDVGSPDGSRAEILEESITIEIPHTTLRQLHDENPLILDAWNRLCGVRVGRLKRRGIQIAQNKVAVISLENPMESSLIRLQGRALSLNEQLKDLKDRRDRGRIDDGRYADLYSDLNSEKIRILLELRTALLGKDVDLDEIVSDAVRGGTEDSELYVKLAAVAEKKGLGASVVEKLNQNKGTIVSWIVEIGLAVIKGAAK